MQNEFEKKVKEKMNELNFVPSEPVWQGIESKIRPEKERRRRLLWIPLFMLGIAALGYLGYNLAGEQNAAQTEQSHSASTPTASKQLSTTRETNSPENLTIDPAFPYQESESADQNKIVLSSKKETSTAPATVYKSSLPKKQQTSLAGTNRVEMEKSIAASFDKKSFEKADKTVTDQSTILTEEKNNEIKELKLDKSRDINSHPFISSEPEIIIEEQKQSKSMDSAVAKPKVVKIQQDRKWKLAIVATGGPSGIGKGLGGSTNKDFYSPISTPPLTANADLLSRNAKPEGFSFSAGIAVKKELSGRLRFSTGLQYQMHQHKILVGKDTAVLPTIGNQFTTISNGSPKNYQNRYHFISLPLNLEWQVFRSLPLRLEGGLSISRLVHTNALVFNQSSNIYQERQDAFNKMQYFSTLGLNYSFKLNKGSFQVGPQLQYGLGSIEKGRSDKHLYTMGLKTEIIF